jgi:hypothetical protein
LPRSTQSLLACPTPTPRSSGTRAGQTSPAWPLASQRGIFAFRPALCLSLRRRAPGFRHGPQANSDERPSTHIGLVVAFIPVRDRGRALWWSIQKDFRTATARAGEGGTDALRPRPSRPRRRLRAGAAERPVLASPPYELVPRHGEFDGSFSEVGTRSRNKVPRDNLSNPLCGGTSSSAGIRS